MNKPWHDDIRTEMERIKTWQRWAREHPYADEAIRFGDAADQRLESLEHELAAMNELDSESRFDQ